MSTKEILKWAAGFTVGVATIVWMYSNFITKERFLDYVIMNNDNLKEMKLDIKEIKTKLNQGR
jgi:hypothetical protein